MSRVALAMVTVVAAAACRTRETAPPGANPAKALSVPAARITNSIGMEFVWIEAGSFKMGKVGEGTIGDGPAHTVTLGEGFYLQTTAVTHGQWQAVMGANPSRAASGETLPVASVSWEDAHAFLKQLNAKEGSDLYRLPTEAEWEYACRAGGREPDEAVNLGDEAWTSENADGRSHPVGTKKPNAWGLFDMRGNVMNWVEDRHRVLAYQDISRVDPLVSPTVPARISDDDSRVVRGGSWTKYYTPWTARCSGRWDARFSESADYIGFRCARGL